MTEPLYDHPKPIVCLCGHHLGKHDRSHACVRCLECSCQVYFTDWFEANKLGFFPDAYPLDEFYPATTPRTLALKNTARTRWLAYKR